MPLVYQLGLPLQTCSPDSNAIKLFLFSAFNFPQFLTKSSIYILLKKSVKGIMLRLNQGHKFQPAYNNSSPVNQVFERSLKE